MAIIKVEKNINYSEETDTYYVQFTFKDLSRRINFPTLEDAREYRDTINAAKLKFKIDRDLEVIRKQELEEVYNEIPYPYSFFDQIKGFDLSFLNTDHVDNFDEILHEFCTEREAYCFVGFFNHKKRLKAMADELGVTRERIRQVVAKANRKLSHYYLREMRRTPEERLAQEKSAIRQELIRFFRENPKLTDELVNEFSLSNRDFGVAVKPISELGLSTRAYYALSRAGIRSVGELISKSADDILKIKNLGKQSFREITAKLDKLGVKLYRDVR